MKKTKFLNRKVAVVSVLVMMMVMITSIAYAAGTPSWWDNPSGASSWNTSGQFFGDAANSGGSNLTVIIDNDVITCNTGDHVELWVQIAWVNTGTPDVNLLTAPPSNRPIDWTYDPAGCPANVTLPLPEPTDGAVLTNRLAFTPTGNSLPSGIPFTDGYERSFTFPDSTTTCARPRTVFSIPDGAGFEYRVETQSVCVSPTAVTLEQFSAGTTSDSTSTLPIMGFSVLTVLALIGAGVFVVRREQKQA